MYEIAVCIQCASFRSLKTALFSLRGSLALHGSASDWCAQQEALYKCIDTIQYNVMQCVVLCMYTIRNKQYGHKNDSLCSAIIWCSSIGLNSLATQCAMAVFTSVNHVQSVQISSDRRYINELRLKFLARVQLGVLFLDSIEQKKNCLKSDLAYILYVNAYTLNHFRKKNGVTWTMVCGNRSVYIYRRSLGADFVGTEKNFENQIFE